MPGFAAELWRSIGDVYEGILRHPFLEGLTSGGLDIDVFKHYIIQDTLYLGAFARAVALVGVKADQDDDALALLANAHASLSFERKSLHEFLLSEWGLAAEELSRYTMSPVNTAYTNFLTATAYDKPFIQGLAAILPCFWVYLEVGKTLVRKGSPNKTYQRWIETYASEEYERNVKALVEIVDKHGEKISETEARAAIRLFRLSTVYEYLFWDESYRLVGWPFRL